MYIAYATIRSFPASSSNRHVGLGCNPHCSESRDILTWMTWAISFGRSKTVISQTNLHAKWVEIRSVIVGVPPSAIPHVTHYNRYRFTYTALTATTVRHVG